MIREKDGLVDIYTYCDVDDGKWYFKLTYQDTRADGVYNIIFPKVECPFPDRDFVPTTKVLEKEMYALRGTGFHAYNDELLGIELLSKVVDVCSSGIGSAYSFDGINHLVYGATVVEVKVKDNPKKRMTIEEIEKALGYGVEIIE